MCAAEYPLSRSGSWSQGYRRVHPRDIVRLDAFQKLVAAGIPEEEAVCRVVLDQGFGLKRYVDNPDRIHRRGEIARAKARLLARAAPEQLERVRVETESRLAASAGEFATTIEEVARGEGLRTRDDAAIARARTEAASVGLGAIGVGPRGGAANMTQVNVGLQTAEAATAAHVANSAAADRIARKLRGLRFAVEVLLGVCPDAELAARVQTDLEARELRIRPIRNVNSVPWPE